MRSSSSAASRNTTTAARADDDAIVHGLAATGQIITAAALIMVSVFASFLLIGDPIVEMFGLGLGLAAAIAIDATIVRCLLVPAVMAVLGRASWWCPRWLARLLPTIDLDGTRWTPAARSRPGCPRASEG